MCPVHSVVSAQASLIHSLEMSAVVKIDLRSLTAPSADKAKCWPAIKCLLNAVGRMGKDITLLLYYRSPREAS